MKLGTFSLKLLLCNFKSQKYVWSITAVIPFFLKKIMVILRPGIICSEWAFIYSSIFITTFNTEFVLIFYTQGNNEQSMFYMFYSTELVNGLVYIIQGNKKNWPGAFTETHRINMPIRSILSNFALPRPLSWNLETLEGSIINCSSICVWSRVRDKCYLLQVELIHLFIPLLFK